MNPHFKKGTNPTCESNTVRSSSRKRPAVEHCELSVVQHCELHPAVSVATEGSTLHVPKITQKVESSAFHSGKKYHVCMFTVVFLGGKKVKMLTRSCCRKFTSKQTSEENLTFFHFRMLSMNLLPLMLNFYHNFFSNNFTDLASNSFFFWWKFDFMTVIKLSTQKCIEKKLKKHQHN